MQNKILILEDDEHIGEVLCDLLAMENYEVKFVANGLEGLSCLEAGFIPNVILVDVFMPRMGGAEFFEAFCRKFPDLVALTHVVFMTAAAPVDIPAGHDPEKILSKPMDINVFLNKMEELCKKN